MKKISIITSNNKEFIYTENHWIFRDYVWLKYVISKKITIEDDVFNQLLFYILYCSKNRISSIIWVPSNLDSVDDVLKNKNSLFRNKFNIKDKKHSNVIIRLISSDGATVINTNGVLEYFGCIIDLSNAKIKGVKGTGETAAGLLSSNGIAFKISQDGTIKYYFAQNRNPILF